MAILKRDVLHNLKKNYSLYEKQLNYSDSTVSHVPKTNLYKQSISES